MGTHAPALINQLLCAAAGVSLAAACSAPAEGQVARPNATQSCAPESGLSFLCGIANPEDVAVIPGSRWLVTGSFVASPTGGLYAIDSKHPALIRLYPTKSARTKPDRTLYPDCATPPDPRNFSALGLSIRPRKNGGGTLYVVGGGARHGIEVFTIDLSGARPRATWIGCVKAPDGATLNGVAGLSNGDILTTAIFEAPKSFKDVMTGQVTGNVYSRAAGQPFSKVPGTALSGPNGIEVTRDHRWMFVAETGKRRVLRYDRTDMATAPVSVPLPFGPDNLRWAPDHQLLVSGQERSSNCAGPAPCPPLANVTALDPVTLKTEVVTRFPVPASWSGLSGAALVDGTLWLGSHTADRIAFQPAKH